MRRHCGVVLDRESVRSAVKKLAIETVVPALVGIGLGGYVLFRCARGAWRMLVQAYVEFVSG